MGVELIFDGDVAYRSLEGEDQRALYASHSAAGGDIKGTKAARLYSRCARFATVPSVWISKTTVTLFPPEEAGGL